MLGRRSGAPLHRGCDLSASLARPQNRPGRCWRPKGGRKVALVVQVWHRGRSDLAMDAMVAVKFWACSKQSHKGRGGGRSLTGCSNEAGGRHTHRRGRRMDAHGSVIGRPIKNAYCFKHCVSIQAMLLLTFGRPTASIETLSHHGLMAMVLPPLCLPCVACCATTAARWLNERTRVVLQQLHRKVSFWVWATTERPGQFSGRSKVARRPQPCVKGA